MISASNLKNADGIALSGPDIARIVNRLQSISRYQRQDEIINLQQRVKEDKDFAAWRLEKVLELNSYPNRTLPPVRCPNFFLLYVTGGKGEKTIGAQNVQIAEGSLYLVSKGMVHSTNFWSPGVTGYMIEFDRSFFELHNFAAEHIFNRKMFRTAAAPFIEVNHADRAACRKVFEQVVLEYERNGQAKNQSLSIKLIELIIFCERMFAKAGQSGGKGLRHPVIEKFNELVELNFSHFHNVNWYAEQLGVHPNHLNFLMKKYSDINAKEYLNNRVILEVKCLLLASGSMIKDIAYSVGFDDPNNFSTFFQKNTGCSPATFRDSNVLAPFVMDYAYPDKS